MIREPAFWWREGVAGRPVAARMLAPVSALYGAITLRRMDRQGASAAAPVICVGNLTVGGAGKTPTAIALAELLRAAGRRPVFLSRGYGGALAGPVRVAPDHRARDVGDEPLLLARHAPAIVSRDRVSGAQAAIETGGDVIVMDDGLQNPALTKDFRLAVVDGERGVGNGLVFPAGPLRAGVARQLAHVDAMLVIGKAGVSAQAVATVAQRRGVPVFTGALTPAQDALAALKGVRTLAFAGIGHPEKFFATLAHHGVDAARTIAFADHRPYGARDAAMLIAAAERDDLTLVTTEKDFARMSGEPALAVLSSRVVTLPVTLALDDEAELMRLVMVKIARPGAAASSLPPG